MTANPFTPEEQAQFDAAYEAEQRAARDRILAEDKAKLDAMPFGEIFEASGQFWVKSAFKGAIYLVRVPKLANFNKRQKLAKKARQAAREQGLLK